MSLKEQRKINIPSCKINKEILIELTEFLEEESKKVKVDKNSNVSFGFTIDSKDKDITAHTVESFREIKIPKQLESIRFHLRDYKTGIDISINLEFSWASTSRFTVEGSDAIWVNGITSRLEEIFQYNKTKNYLFHEKKSKIPIALGIAFLIAFSISFVMFSYLPDNLEDPKSLDDLFSYTITLGVSMFILFLYFLEWLFPVIEFENYQIQIKIRKIFSGIIVAIILGLIVTGLAKILF